MTSISPWPSARTHASSVLVGRIVSVDDGKFVAMPHRAQCREEVGAEQRRNADQHLKALLARGCADQKSLGQRKAGAAKRACMDADRSFADRRNAQAFDVDPGDRGARGIDKPLPGRSRHPAVDDGGLEIDDRGSRDDGVGQRGAGRFEPGIELRPVARPPFRRSPQIGGVDAALVERLLQDRQRCDVDQLGGATVGAGNRHRTERARRCLSVRCTACR